MQMLLTLLTGCAGGALFLRLKIPAGGIVGAMCAVALYHILFGNAFAPWYFKLFAQSVTGAFIAMPLTLQKLKSMRTVLVPALVVVGGMLLFSILMAYGCAALSGGGMDLLTALFFCAPGGMSDIVLISSEIGGDTLLISAGHAIRSFFVLGLLPLLNQQLLERLVARNPQRYGRGMVEAQNAGPGGRPPFSMPRMLLTLAIALAGGMLGRLSGIPAGTLIFSLVAVSVVHIPTQAGCMPVFMRRFAQICAGTLIGCSITRQSLLSLRHLLLPLGLLLLGNLVMNLSLGLLLYRCSNLDLGSALFATIPAGVADMALLADEMSGDGAKVALIQTIRLVSVISIFPQVYLMISS